MSEKTARARRKASQNGNAAEIKWPGIDDLLRVDDRAKNAADALLNMSLRKLELAEMMEDNKLRESDLIPGMDKTFREQIKLIIDAYNRRWERIEEAGFRADVQEILSNRG